MPMEYLFLIILLVFMIGMMFFQTRKAKQQQEERKNLLRFTFRAINREYVRPAYVSDDDVDENGNPIDHNADQQGEPEQIETTVEETVTETDDDDQAPMPKQ